MPEPFPSLPPGRRGTVHRPALHAPCLVGNPWGDPATREILVYTPHGYTDPSTRYPVVLVLPAFAGSAEGMLARGLGDVPLSTRIDRLIANGCPPFIAVIPDAITRIGGSQYLDSEGIGMYQTWVTDVIRPWVDATFRTSGRWGVTGRSSGGFGAFHLAVRAPEVFRAVALHAPDCAFDLCYLGELLPAIRGIAAAGGVDGFHDWFWSQHRPSSDAFAAFNLLAMSCAYSPDPAARPIPARLPFDPDTGAIFHDVLRSWQRYDPIVCATLPNVQDALRKLDLLFMDAGDRDEYGLHLGVRRLAATLSAAGVAVHHDEFPGGHRGTAWRFDHSLALLARTLSEGAAGG